MKMSSQSRYGLRAMVAIAGSAQGPSRSEQLAEKEGVSKKYLDAILGSLREAGLLRTVRGPGGGYVLARPAARISHEDRRHRENGRMGGWANHFGFAHSRFEPQGFVARAE